MDNVYIRYDIVGFARDMEVDLTTISELYSEYFLEMKNNMEESMIFLKNNDWQMLQRRVHNMKGISSTLRVDDVYHAANILDHNLKAREYLNADKDIMTIMHLLDYAEKDIKDFFHQNSIYI